MNAIKHALFHVGATVAAIGLAAGPVIPQVAKFIPSPWGLVASLAIAGIQGVVAYRSKKSKSVGPAAK